MTDQPPSPPIRRTGRLRLAVVGFAGVLVGALITVGVIAIVNYEPTLPLKYDVTAFLKADVTDEQRTAVERALATLRPADGVRYESSEQAYENFKELFKDRPDLVNEVRPDTLPQSFRLTVENRTLACAELEPIQAMDGVDDIVVMQYPRKKGGLPGKPCG